MTEIVTAARINNLQASVALLLGNGAGERGYGQTLYSSQISTAQNKIIQASDMNSLFEDLIRIRIHQIGQDAVLGAIPLAAKVIESVGVVGLTASNNIEIDAITGAVIASPDITNNINYSELRGIVDYETLASAAESGKYSVHPLQTSTEVALRSVRTTAWNTAISHEFTVVFTNADHRRHFFNSGGKLYINAALTSPVGEKSINWSNFLGSLGTVEFNYNTTTAIGSNVNAGNNNLTSVYQILFQQVVTGVSTYTVKAKELSSNSIKFLIELDDIAQDADGLIYGRLETTITHARANGTATYVNPNTLVSKTIPTVVVSAPTYITNIELSSALAPSEIYSLTSNKSTVVNSDTFIITLNTLNVQKDTLIPYTITGVTSANINGAALTGNLTVLANGIATKTFTTEATIADNATFVLTLNNMQKNVTVTLSKTVIPLPVSENRTCISVIDETDSSVTVSTIAKDWLNFRSRYPNRPFYLLQPVNPKYPIGLKEPPEFHTDPNAYGPITVNRDGGNQAMASDWYTICKLDQLPDGSKIAIFIDTSGSMTMNTVQASYTLLLKKLAARNMTFITVSNKVENWVAPFDLILN